MSHRTGTTTGPAGTSAAVGGPDRLTLLRAAAASISGRGRVLGPAGGWVRVDFDDIRQQMGTTG